MSIIRPLQWLLLLAMLASWELLLIFPERIWYLFVLQLVASAFLSVELSKDIHWRLGIWNRISFILFSSGVFWWLLWLDFEIIKFLFPVVIWAPFAYLFLDLRKKGDDVTPKMRLTLFLGSTFFWASNAFGLGTVLGISTWISIFGLLAIQAVSFIPAVRGVLGNNEFDPRAYLILLLLGAESFAVLVWLPFTEITLGALYTVLLFAVYDLLKYYLNPDFIRGSIIAKKVFGYVVFICLILLSTSWK